MTIEQGGKVPDWVSDGSAEEHMKGIDQRMQELAEEEETPEAKEPIVIHNIAIPNELEDALNYYQSYVRHCVSTSTFVPWKIQPYMCFIEKRHKSYYTLQDYIGLMGIDKFGEFIKKQMSFYSELVKEK